MWGGIRDALAAGDLALAGKIAMAALQVAWTAGIGVIKRAWAIGVNEVLGTVYGLKYGMEEAIASAFYGVLTIGAKVWAGLQVGWAVAVAGMSAAWQTFTASIREGFAAVSTAAQKMKVYLDLIKNPATIGHQRWKIDAIDAEAAKEKAARKQQNAEAMAGIITATGARIKARPPRGKPRSTRSGPANAPARPPGTPHFRRTSEG